MIKILELSSDCLSPPIIKNILPENALKTWFLLFDQTFMNIKKIYTGNSSSPNSDLILVSYIR